MTGRKAVRRDREGESEMLRQNADDSKKKRREGAKERAKGPRHNSRSDGGERKKKTATKKKRKRTDTYAPPHDGREWIDSYRTDKEAISFGKGDRRVGA